MPKTNPYLESMKKSNSDVKNASAARRTFTFITTVLLIVNAGLAVGMYKLSTQSKILPVEVRIAPDNEIVYSKALKPLQATDPIVKKELITLVEDIRSVYADYDANFRSSERSLAYFSEQDPAFNYMSKWYAKNNPHERSKEMTVKVDPVSAIKYGGSWNIEWIETTFDRGGREIDRARWEAIISFEVGVQRDDKDNQEYLNPLGIYVVDIDWSRETT